MKKMRSVFLALVLALPIIGALSLAIEKHGQINDISFQRVPILASYPRTILYGHVVYFIFDGPNAPNTEAQSYEIPQDQLPDFQRKPGTTYHDVQITWNPSEGPEDSRVCKNIKSLEMDIQLRGDGLVLSYGTLYVNGKPWREFDEKQAISTLASCPRK